jgi:diguanylate cyclase (GGDEF)-like protein
LTGIANRALFFDRLRHSLPQAERNSERVGVLYLDMDGLKEINDSYGHRAGDAAIKELAVRITHGLRQADTAARLGGDEFGLIITRLTDRSAVMLVIKRLLARINDPFVFEDRLLPLAVSVGLALYPDDGDEIEVLVEKADQSMYADKRSRRLAQDVTYTSEVSTTHSFPAPKMFISNPVELLDR